MNKKEAEQKVEEWKIERKKVFCPLINGMCRIDCQCIDEMRAEKFLCDDEDSWHTLYGYCTCRVLVGEG